ncbi:hypothetical protein BJY52DRAFT_426633 [Lactarius psammicola]|nr:hypothetical protein BJY52DRAFT_426633 [Lactarius psammicola]
MRLRATGLCLILEMTKMVRCHGSPLPSVGFYFRFWVINQVINRHTGTAWWLHTVELDFTLYFLAGTIAGGLWSSRGIPIRHRRISHTAVRNGKLKRERSMSHALPHTKVEYRFQCPVPNVQYSSFHTLMTITRE